MLIVFSEREFCDFNNISLIKFLQKKTDISFLQLKKLFREKKIYINDKKVKDNYILNINDKIEIFNYKQNHNNEKHNSDFQKKNYSRELLKDIKDNILFEDENLIFFNKKRGICVQGGNNIAFSLEDVLSFIYNTKIRIVHRIDKETLGIIIFAKNYKSAIEITNLFQEKKIQKTYFAITEGIPLKNKGIINDDILYKELNITKTAITEYEVIDKKNNFALLKISPKTGRKHQIRIHLAKINCPILGDTKYNKNKTNHDMQLYSFSIKIPNYKEISIDYNIMDCFNKLF